MAIDETHLSAKFVDWWFPFFERSSVKVGASDSIGTVYFKRNDFLGA